jgi:hypothetical protein
MGAMPLRVLGCVTALFVAFALITASAVAQPRTAQTPIAAPPSPMTPGSAPLSAAPLSAVPASTPQNGIPAPPPMAVQPAVGAGGTVVLAPGDVGICQCIADRTSRKLSCLSSAAECQSSCASTHYAFTPHAIYSCPMTADSASAAMSPSR